MDVLCTSKVRVQTFQCPWPSCRTEGSKIPTLRGLRLILGKKVWLDFQMSLIQNKLAVLCQKHFDIEKYFSNHSTDRSELFYKAD